MMNQAQLKYAAQRANDLYSAKKQALTNKHTNKGVSLTAKEKLAALAAGEYTVLSFEEENKYQNGSWYSYVKFNVERPTVVDKEALTADELELKTKFRALMDELMLGDNEEALRLIKAFEAA